MNFEEKTISRKEIYKGHVVHLVVDEVELPENKGKSTRELILHRGAVAILAKTPNDKLIFVKQYRKAIEKAIYEIPAGKLEEGENKTPLDAALRELEEETHYTGQLEEIASFYTAVGFSNEKIILYQADQLTKVANPRPQDADETLELYEFTLEEAKHLIETGDICDAKTILALQYQELLDKNK